MSSDAETARDDLDKLGPARWTPADAGQASRVWKVDDEAKQDMTSVSFHSATTCRTLRRRCARAVVRQLSVHVAAVVTVAATETAVLVLTALQQQPVPVPSACCSR